MTDGVMEKKIDQKKIKEFCLYNKVPTGITGLDRVLYSGLVLPEVDNLIIVIRGADNTDKTMLSIQLLNAIASHLPECFGEISISYYCNFLKKDYFEDKLVDFHIASAIQALTSLYVQGRPIEDNVLTNTFFNVDKIVAFSERTSVDTMNFPSHEELRSQADRMICEEALYYNNRTNALHLRLKPRQDNISDKSNAVFARRINGFGQETIKSLNLCELENGIHTKYCATEFEEIDNDLSKVVSVIGKRDANKNADLIYDKLLCVNYATTGLEESKNVVLKNMEALLSVMSHYKISILVIRDDIPIPIERVGMIIDMSQSIDNAEKYDLYHLKISKSRYQVTALGQHQYKSRDYGLEVYPSLHVYCQHRRYLQRALVYTHSNVLSETYQQYIDQEGENGSYQHYLQTGTIVKEGILKALSPSAYKNFSMVQVLDRIFINPVSTSPSRKSKYDNINDIETDFLYGHNGGITAVIGEGNTFKRFLTFGSAFSSAHRKEHTLFLLMNKDDKIARRRFQCPARKNKLCTEDCEKCYEYMHFMDIILGCITPEELLYFLIRQIETSYKDGKGIARIVIDDLQIVEYCFPFLADNSLFLPALVDECRERGVALYILCDKKSKLVEPLRSLSDNVVCTERDKKGRLQLYVERYSGYMSKPSKIYHGVVKDYEKLFQCVEISRDNNRNTEYEFNIDYIDEINHYSMKDYWKN